MAGDRADRFVITSSAGARPKHEAPRADPAAAAGVVDHGRPQVDAARGSGPHLTARLFEHREPEHHLLLERIFQLDELRQARLGGRQCQCLPGRSIGGGGEPEHRAEAVAFERGMADRKEPGETWHHRGDTRELRDRHRRQRHGRQRASGERHLRKCEGGLRHLRERHARNRQRWQPHPGQTAQSLEQLGAARVELIHDAPRHVGRIERRVGDRDHLHGARGRSP